MSKTPNRSALPDDYPSLLAEVKRQIATSRVRAVSAANTELIMLYWQIGRSILERQQSQPWGAKVIDRLAADLKMAYPDMTGLSVRNLKYMKKFAESWPDGQIVQQLVAQIPWGHNLALLDRLSDESVRRFYAERAIEHGWSRNVMVLQIESDLHEREGKAITNFDKTLPPPDSDLARQSFKDPYLLDFVGMEQPIREKQLENALVTHIEHFLLELGAGFAFVGRQLPLEVGDGEYFIDLLFYHLQLHCYVVIELKSGGFKPEYAGKMNFYLSAVDDLVRDAQRDGPTLGLLLCHEKNRIAAEYALRDINKPLAVAEWTTQLTRSLPKELQSQLPTIEEIESELSGEV